MSSGSFFYPNVTRTPSQPAPPASEKKFREADAVNGDFKQIYEKTLDQAGLKPDLEQLRAPLKFSAHAYQRLQDRKIKFDSVTLSKINDAVDKADSKGVEDTLIITGDAALIVNVKNRTVITALDKNSMSGNVFTNIDGAVVV